MIKQPVPRPVGSQLASSDTTSLDLSSAIDSYIQKSPITNKFREENPNLRPVDDSASNSTKVDDSDLSAMKRTLDVPDNGGKRLDKKSSYYSTQPANMSEYTGERLPSPSIDLMDIANEKESARNDLPQESPLQQQQLNNGSIKKKMKRFSFQSLASNFKDSERLSTKKSNRFSLSGSLGRLSMSSVPSQPSSTATVYRADINASRTSLSSTSEMSMMTTETDFISAPNTPFWKYHILKFGKDLYLTTNPGLKHMYCRNGPGYYIETIFLDKSKKPKVQLGFTLIFKDINSIEANKKDNRPPAMIITKKAESEGGYFTVSIPRNTQPGRHGGTVMHFGGPNSHKSIYPKQTKSPMFNGLMIPKKINPTYIPQESPSLDQQHHHHPHQPQDFKNYEFKDFNNFKWNVGSIPRVRPSKMNKIRSRLRKTASSGTLNQSESGQVPGEHLKFVGKKNIYFHQNYLEEEDWKNPMNVLYKQSSGDPSKIYLHDSNSEFPPVLGLFRPYETKARKRIINSISKNRTIFQNRPHTASQMHQQQQAQQQQMQNQDFNRSSESLSTMGTESTKISRNSVSYDIAGGDVRNYFRGGDGLYYSVNPSDDTPDDNKLGWITIYEDQRLFTGNQNKGMFEIVLGLTLAVGFESTLS